MKKVLSTLIGAATVVAMAGLPSAAFAAQSPSAGRALTVDGQVEMMKIDASRGAKKEALGVVTPEGLVYLLTPSRTAPAAYKKARNVASRQDWYEVSGRTGTKDGMPSLTVQKISET